MFTLANESLAVEGDSRGRRPRSVAKVDRFRRESRKDSWRVSLPASFANSTGRKEPLRCSTGTDWYREKFTATGATTFVGVSGRRSVQASISLAAFVLDPQERPSGASALRRGDARLRRIVFVKLAERHD